MKIVALTGNIASGKSTVGALFRESGTPVIDYDSVIRELQQPGEQAFGEIVRRFGNEVVDPQGQLDRSALRTLILNDVQAKIDLERILHPAARERVNLLLNQLNQAGAPMVVVEIPLLFETGMEKAYDAIILVDAPAAMRQERLVRNRGISPEEAGRLLAAQLPSEAKRAQADWIIDNDGDHSALTQRAHAVWEKLRQ